jgi:hypothetical protein
MNLISLRAFSSPSVSFTIFNLDDMMHAIIEIANMINLTDTSTDDIFEIEKNDTISKINERVKAVTA